MLMCLRACTVFGKHQVWAHADKNLCWTCDALLAPFCCPSFFFSVVSEIEQMARVSICRTAENTEQQDSAPLCRRRVISKEQVMHGGDLEQEQCQLQDVLWTVFLVKAAEHVTISSTHVLCAHLQLQTLICSPQQQVQEHNKQAPENETDWTCSSCRWMPTRKYSFMVCFFPFLYLKQNN